MSAAERVNRQFFFILLYKSPSETLQMLEEAYGKVTSGINVFMMGAKQLVSSA
jgi:hypothetical protein